MYFAIKWPFTWQALVTSRSIKSIKIPERKGERPIVVHSSYYSTVPFKVNHFLANFFLKLSSLPPLLLFHAIFLHVTHVCPIHFQTPLKLHFFLLHSARFTPQNISRCALVKFSSLSGYFKLVPCFSANPLRTIAHLYPSYTSITSCYNYVHPIGHTKLISSFWSPRNWSVHAGWGQLILLLWFQLFTWDHVSFHLCFSKEEDKEGSNFSTQHWKLYTYVIVKARRGVLYVN